MKTNAEKNTKNNSNSSFFQQGYQTFFSPKSTFFSPTIQTKLEVGSPNDRYEQEADSIADRVINNVGNSSISESSQGIQRKCAACEEEEKVQRKPLNITPIIQKSGNDGGGVANEAISSQITASKGGGNPMGESTKNFMENRFGNDFSGVRIHTDSNAIQLSQNLDAQAFTVGNDVFFNQGKYSPDSDSGKHLLAHELVHTVQQNGGEIDRKIQKLPRRDRIHDSIEDDFGRETGTPRDRTSHHGSQYEAWLHQRTAIMDTFDSYQLLPEHLTDSTVQNRFDRMTLEEIYEYRNEYISNGANNPDVVTYLTNLMTGRPVQPCSAEEIERTNRKAQTAMSDMSTLINNADRAMTLLHSTWINNKSDLLSRNLHLVGEVACAFKSNFNIDETNADFGVAHIRVMRRIQQFQRRLLRPVTFTCEGINNPICLGGRGLDAEAYVIDHQSPIHLCIGFRESFSPNLEQATIVHEFMHLLPGVGDDGGYALGGFGTIVTSCNLRTKFSAETNLLTNSADSLAGFVMHIAQNSPTDLRVR